MRAVSIRVIRTALARKILTVENARDRGSVPKSLMPGVNAGIQNGDTHAGAIECGITVNVEYRVTSILGTGRIRDVPKDLHVVVRVDYVNFWIVRQLFDDAHRQAHQIRVKGIE